MIQRCFRVELAPGVYEGPNFSKVTEDRARIYKTRSAAKQSAAVKHRHGKIIECVVIETARLANYVGSLTSREEDEG